MEDSGQSTQLPPPISFGPPGGWRAAAIAVASAVIMASFVASIAARWLRPAVTDALEWAVRFATILVVYRWLSARAWRPRWMLVVVAWVSLAVLAFVVEILLTSATAPAS